MHAQRNRRPRWRAPSDSLVLAAVDRAQRHHHPHREDDDGATLATIAAHLGIAWGPVASRRLRPLVERLTAELGWLQYSRRHGLNRWALSKPGELQLTQAAADGQLEELPESPQHREWRAARAYATARLDGLRDELGEQLAALTAALDSRRRVPATEWLSTADALSRATRALAAASCCIHERQEPDDDAAAGAAPSGLGCWSHPRMWDPGHAE